MRETIGLTRPANMVRMNVAIFFMALTTLMMELCLIRVFDVILSANMAYMVVTCAMFTFGLAGIYAVLKPWPASADVRHILSWLALLFGVSTLFILPTMNLLPFDYTKIGAAPLSQILFFLGMYLGLAVPFFFSGLFFTTMFSSYAEKIQSLYFWDLVGGAVGCVILIPFVPKIGPGGLLFCAGAFGILSSGLLSQKRAWTLWSIILGIGLIAVPFLRSTGYYDFREHVEKRQVKADRQQGKVEMTYWDPVSKIDIINTDRITDGKTRKHVAYDGGSQSSHIFPFDGDFQGLRRLMPALVTDHFWNRGVLASHYLKRDSDQRVLIIGSAAGQETKAALMYGASHVDAVEMVGFVVYAGKTYYADLNGGIFNHPNVNVQVGEGRSFLRASTHKYDIIQIYSNHTTSSMAAGTGAMATTYLQTAEAYREYIEHLADDGILHINHHIYPKMITTAALAWKQMGRHDFSRHVVVFERAGRQDNLPTMLIKNKPWTQLELDALGDFFSLPSNKNRSFNLVGDPLRPENNFLSPEFYAGDFPKALAKTMLFRVSPSTDNLPYFNFLRKKIGKVEPGPESFLDLSTAAILNSQLRKFVPMDIVHLIVTGGASLFFAVIFTFIPLHFSQAGKSAWPRKKSALVYFSCLGAGFIIFELVFIQIFMKLVGFPLYTYATIVFALLLSAGVGSFSSQRLKISLKNRWYWPFVGIFVTGGFLLLTHAFFFNIFLATPLLVRALVAFLLIAPLGFFLGMPFPLGILAIQEEPKGAIAWAWGLNGLFTVIGGLASVLCSIFLGFRESIFLALLIYVVAFLMFSRIRHSSAAA